MGSDIKKRVRTAVVLFLLPVFIFSGCAWAVVKTQTPPSEKAPVKNEVKKNEPAIESGAYVVRAKRLTRLETLKKEAAHRNNTESSAVLAGTAAAIAAFTMSDAYFRVKEGKDNPLASMCITAVAAYAAAAIAVFFYGKLAD